MNLCKAGLLALLFMFLWTAPPAAAEEAMADMPTASALIAFAREALGAGYIYGAAGQVCDENFRHGRINLYPQYEALIRRWGEQWDGLPVYDCIGLLKAFAASFALPSRLDVNTTGAWEIWVSDWGPLEGAKLTPGMALFRIEGGRMLVRHIGIYAGEGRVIHARGTRWGVVEDLLPNVFTHWATLDWIDHDLPRDGLPVVDGPFLPPGALAVVETSDGEKVTASQTPYEAGKLRPTSTYFDDGAILLVLQAPDEMSRLVVGEDTRGRTVEAYIRLTELREAQRFEEP